MALAYSTIIPLKEVSPIVAKKISLVIPVKDNQPGIDGFLSSFFKTHQPAYFPGEIIIVDNDSAVPIQVPDKYTDSALPVSVYLCKKPGPASARNLGAKHAKGEWLLFVDSDCIPTPAMIKGYLDTDRKAVGYQGTVSVYGEDTLSSYYSSQQIHLPPTMKGGAPKYLVTANVLVNKEAFDRVGGFDETFAIAGGEDIELAVRLASIGKLAFVPESIILHNFDDGFSGFIKRFVRYGRGLRLVKKISSLGFLPPPFTANKKIPLINNVLVIVQWLSLCWGYLWPGRAANLPSKESI